MNQVLRDVLDRGRISDEHGQSYPITEISIPAAEGRYIQQLIRERKPKVTLEIGCAFGVSSLFICEALRDVGGTKHIMIDTWSEASRIATAHLDKAGFDGLYELHLRRSFEALSELLANGVKNRLRVDRWHAHVRLCAGRFLSGRQDVEARWHRSDGRLFLARDLQGLPLRRGEPPISFYWPAGAGAPVNQSEVGTLRRWPLSFLQDQQGRIQTTSSHGSAITVGHPLHRAAEGLG
jgi:hypothetical protein